MRSVGKRALDESGKHPVNEDDEEKFFARMRAFTDFAMVFASSYSRYRAEEASLRAK